MHQAQLDELERILTNEPRHEPMIGFSTRVLRRVREEAATPAPIRFPWARLLLGLVPNLLLLLAAVVWVARQPASAWAGYPFAAEGFSLPVQGALAGCVAIVLSLAVAGVASRWVAPRRSAVL